MQSKQKNQLAALKSDCGLFSKLYISCQTRHGDMYEFFSHENHAFQQLYQQVANCELEGNQISYNYCLKSSHSEDRSEALLDATVLDDAALAEMLSCGRSKTFQEYANTLFVP